MLEDGSQAIAALHDAGCCGSGAGRRGKTAVCEMQHVLGEGTAIHSPDLAS